MYNVSDKYLEAFRKGVAFDRIRGRIWLKNGDILTVDDSFLVRNKLSITRRVCKGELDIGTFNKAEMRISVYDDNAYDNEYAGARIILAYELAVDKTESGDYVFESVPLGTFYVDGKQSKRVRNELSLVAYDKSSFFDVAIPDTIRSANYANIYELVLAVCLYCNVGFVYTEEEFLALPNANIVPDLKSEQLQSCADLVMWAAQTVACCAFINNLGVLNMKPYYFAADRKADRTVTARERMSISYSDTRTYLAYLTSYSADDVKNYSKLIDYSAQTDGPHIKEGAICFPKNPLLSALSASDCDTINNAYLDNAAFPTRYIESKCFVDPAIELMDRLAFTGGTIDVDRRIVSVCTEIQWKYRNSGKLVCSNYEEYTGGVEESSTVSLLADDEASAQSETTYDRVPPKSQLEKRIDSIEKNMGNQHYLMSLNDSAKLYHTNFKSTYERNRITIDRTDGDTNVIILERFIENSTGYLSLTSKGKKVNNEYKYGNYFEIKSEDEQMSVTLTGGDLGLISEITSTGDITLYSGTSWVKKPRLELLADGTMYIIANGKRYKVVVQEE